MTSKIQTAEQLAAPKNLAQRLCAIMGELGSLTKSGRNTQQNYSYVREADVSEAVRKLMAKHGVMCIPSIVGAEYTDYETRSGTKMRLCRVGVDYTLINADSPQEREVVRGYGEGSDSSDKSFYKASTGAHKYFLMRLFCLGTEDDPENEVSNAIHNVQHGHTGGAGAPAHAAPPTHKVLTQTSSVHGAPVMRPQDQWAYKIPFDEKDKWRPILRTVRAKWDPDLKLWVAPEEIPALKQYLQGASVQSSSIDEQAQLGFDEDPIPENW